MRDVPAKYLLLRCPWLHAAQAGGAAAAASGQLEDLAGFVHMNMIDDLLSGSE